MALVGRTPSSAAGPLAGLPGSSVRLTQVAKSGSRGTAPQVNPILILSLRLPYTSAPKLKKVQTLGQLRIDPGTLAWSGAAELEIVVPYTEWSVTSEVLRRAAVLASGLNVRIHLVAVHASPYPEPLRCPVLVHARLVEQLVDLAGQCPMPVNPQVVLARYWDEGFRFAMKPRSTVLIGSRRHLWRTAEEKLARALAREGHQVALLHIEKT